MPAVSDGLAPPGNAAAARGDVAVERQLASRSGSRALVAAGAAAARPQVAPGDVDAPVRAAPPEVSTSTCGEVDARPPGWARIGQAKGSGVPPVASSVAMVDCAAPPLQPAAVAQFCVEGLQTSPRIALVFEKSHQTTQTLPSGPTATSA